jgi:hypothetical protein
LARKFKLKDAHRARPVLQALYLEYDVAKAHTWENMDLISTVFLLPKKSPHRNSLEGFLIALD